MTFMLHIQAIKPRLQPLALLCTNNHHYHSSWTLWLPWRHGGISPSLEQFLSETSSAEETAYSMSYKWSHSYLALHFLFQIKHRATESFVLLCKYASLLFLRDFSKGYVWKVQYPTWQRHSIHAWPRLPSEIERKLTFILSSFSSWQALKSVSVLAPIACTSVFTLKIQVVWQPESMQTSPILFSC